MVGAARVLAVGGMTACGKSALALSLARVLGGEILAADSAQVYRGMDIGTDKPDASARRAVPHRLIDICDPAAPFSVAVYQGLADAAIAACGVAGRVPILVGGTGLYFRQVLRGTVLPPAPPQPDLRASLATLPPETLYAELCAVDPRAARAIHPHNVRRIIRALEIHRTTGRPPSSYWTAPALRHPHLLVVLDRPADILRRRIAERVDRMLAGGLVREVQGLLAAGVPPGAPGLQALGYRQVVDHLREGGPAADLAQQISAATWAYARRQRTWFRREPDAVWVDLGEAPAEEALPQVLARWRGTKLR